MSPSDSAIRPHLRLWLPAVGSPALRSRTPNRASQVPCGSFRARCLLSPRGVRSVHGIDSSRPMLASPVPAGWPLPVSCNEAELSSRDATARALAFPSFNGLDRSLPLKGRLHDSRSSIMINTFQLTRTTKLSWRFPDFTDDTDTPSPWPSTPRGWSPFQGSSPWRNPGQSESGRKTHWQWSHAKTEVASN